MPRGGKRNGAGRPKGKEPKTLEKEAAREYVRQMVTQALQPMVEAQIKHAKGLSYLMVRDAASGKFVRVTEAMARQTLRPGETIVEAWEKDPSVQAFSDLLNRALDKPKEQEQTIRITGDDEQIRRLHAGRARARAGREAK
jgi:hypothetical protein